MKSRPNFKKNTVAVAVGVGVIMSGVIARADVNPQLQQQRMEVLAAAAKGAAGLPILSAAMKSPSAIIRRAAARSLAEIGAPGQSALTTALKSDTDVLVRRTALLALTKSNDSSSLGVLETAMSDSSEMLRAAAVQSISDIHPYTPQITDLLKKARQDKSNDVSQIATQALWPFRKVGVSLREKPIFKDHQLSVVQKIPLSVDGWKFQLDAEQTGQEYNWFSPDFSDDKWQDIKITEPWESQIKQEYDGAAWYRHSFNLPAKPAQVGTDIVFEGVDESAWVWINGQYIGQHDIGPTGWDQRFAMDVGNELKWGEKNQITVRVLDRKQAGGIWKPVYLEALKQ